MINKDIEQFLEKTDMNYLFCLLAKMESQRLSQFPSYLRNKLGNKLTVLAMEHVADNEVPDYITELAEAELALAQAQSPFVEDDGLDNDLGEEIDDSSRFIEDIGEEPPMQNPFSFDDEDETLDDFDVDHDDQDDLDED